MTIINYEWSQFKRDFLLHIWMKEKKLRRFRAGIVSHYSKLSCHSSFFYILLNMSWQISENHHVVSFPAILISKKRCERVTRKRCRSCFKTCSKHWVFCCLILLKYSIKTRLKCQKKWRILWWTPAPSSKMHSYRLVSFNSCKFRNISILHLKFLGARWKCFHNSGSGRWNQKQHAI